MHRCLFRASWKNPRVCALKRGAYYCAGSIRDALDVARRHYGPSIICFASIKLQQVPEGKAEALFESVRKLCETMALLRQHELSAELRESVLVTMQGIAEEYGTCLVEHLSAAIPPVGFKRAEAIQQLKELVWGTCNDGLYTCLILDEQSTLLSKVRKYLTISEQIELFEAAPGGWRWSAEEVYDVSLAYLAEAFMKRKPQLVLKAEQLLVWCAQLYMSGGSAGSKLLAKAVYKERAVCAVLLNRFDKAQKLLKLAGGRTFSQIDGWGVHAATSLYIMAEKWMAQELFPRFAEYADVTPSMELWLRETTPFPFFQGREAVSEPLSVSTRARAALQGVVLGAVLMGAMAVAVWRGRDMENPLPRAFASAATLVQINPEKFSARLGFSATFAMDPRPTQVTSELEPESALSSPSPASSSPMMASSIETPGPSSFSTLVASNPELEAAGSRAKRSMILDLKGAESVVQKWQTAKALAWTHPNPEQWLLHCCGPDFMQQTLSTIERDHKSSVYRIMQPQAVKVLTVQQPDGASNTWLVVAYIKETQCEGSETAGGPMVRHQHEYRMQYKLVPHGNKWRIVEAQPLGQQRVLGQEAVEGRSLPHL